MKIEMLFLDKLTYINGIFVIPILSLIGFLLNLLCFIVFMSPKFKLKSKLKFLITKAFLDMIFCSFGIGFQNSLWSLTLENNNTPNLTIINYSFEFQIFKFYLHHYTGNCIFICSGFIQICLNYDRYLILINKKNWFNKIENFKFIIAACGLFSLIVFVPDLFAYKIDSSTSSNTMTNSYFINVTEFGAKKLGSNYEPTVFVILNVIQLIILIQTSFILIVEFRKFIKNKSNISNQMFYFNQNLVLLFHNSQETKRKKAEINFIRMTLTLTVLNCLMKSTDILNILLCKIDFFGRIIIDEKSTQLYLKNFSVLIIYFGFSLNFFILFNFYKRFRKALKNLCSKEFL
jgi:hypothetical protein